MPTAVSRYVGRMKPADLQPDCKNCQALCCVAPPFAQSGEFAISKEEGEPCPNLAGDYTCKIHDQLAEKGFSGCVKFDCFGAGQRVLNGQFKGQRWRSDHILAKRIFHTFFVVKSLHVMMAKLLEKKRTIKDRKAGAFLDKELSELDRLADRKETILAEIDLKKIETHIGEINEIYADRLIRRSNE